MTDPDQVVDRVLGACPGCGADLAGAPDAGVVRRQVYDIPGITATVTEHRLHRRVCGCGPVVTAATPAGLTAAATYGPNLRALAAYLVVF